MCLQLHCNYKNDREQFTLLEAKSYFPVTKAVLPGAAIYGVIIR